VLYGQHVVYVGVCKDRLGQVIRIWHHSRIESVVVGVGGHVFKHEFFISVMCSSLSNVTVGSDEVER
jgi:hypothetical protein